MPEMKPILFNTEMVRAILDGRKTQTRRVVKPQPGEELAYIWGGSNHGKWCYSPYNVSRYEEHRTADDWKYWTPPCHTDDVLWVRETWKPVGYRKPGRAIPADLKDTDFLYRADGEVANSDGSAVRWRPSIHMPKEAARIFLRVTNVRVERLQEISEEQAQSEGAIAPYFYGEGWKKEIGTARDSFVWIWDSTIRPADLDRYGWRADPWVWVIEFERCEKPDIFSRTTGEDSGNAAQSVMTPAM